MVACNYPDLEWQMHQMWTKFKLLHGQLQNWIPFWLWFALMTRSFSERWTPASYSKFSLVSGMFWWWHASPCDLHQLHSYGWHWLERPLCFLDSFGAFIFAMDLVGRPFKCQHVPGKHDIYIYIYHIWRQDGTRSCWSCWLLGCSCTFSTLA